MFFPKTFLLAQLALCLLAMACGTARPDGPFDLHAPPPVPDYTELKNWAAHPDKPDPADRTPCPQETDWQKNAQADVFFLYPTSYYGRGTNSDTWNAALDNPKVNDRTDSTSLLFQASIFNRAGRVFAPRYRQAHLQAFFSKDKKSAEQAVALAYTDVLAAFDYYLKNWNKGRPFIIAGHSQGGLHGMYLVRDRIEGTPLQKRLVAAYLVGWPVKRDFFRTLKPCETPTETGCFCTWQTWERRFGRRKAFDRDVVCTNPLTWSTREGEHAPKNLNKGAILRSFCVVYPQISDAEVHKGILLCTKPKFPGSILFTRKNYHIGDLNLYYYDVRANAQARVEAFLKSF
ncbi:MAG: DUF3089 domain-containing protein [Saprospiraceae bacterium]